MRTSILFLLLFATACAIPEADPPSLGPRDIEGILDEPTYAIAPVESADDAALAARISELVGQAEAGNADFRAALPGTQRAVRRAQGSAAESEAWIVAQVELSALDSARSPTTTAMGALDAIFAAQAIDGTPAETERLAAARARVAELYAAQAQSYQSLQAMLRSR